MQPIELQVERSLAVLRGGVDDLGGLSAHGMDRPEGSLPDGLLEQLEATPAVRPDRLAEARQRLAEGAQPDADELATKMVGRLVCDRLR